MAAGRVVVCGDEWALNNSAFNATNPYRDQYISNLAKYLVGTNGNFLDTTDIPTVGSMLGAKLINLGYSYTKDTTSPITPSLLAPYKAVIFGGLRGRADVAANLTTLNYYVNNGGSVYIFTGTGFFGGAAGEAAGWNPFTAPRGITIGNTFVNPTTAQHVTTDWGTHALRFGVAKLTWGYGNELTVSGNSAIAVRGGPELAANIGMVAATYSGKWIIGSASIHGWEGPAGPPLLIDFLNTHGESVTAMNVEAMQPGNRFMVEAPDPGIYYVAVKCAHTLRKIVGPINTLRNTEGLDFDLVNGDVAPDNEINLLDFAEISKAFGSAPGAPNWNENADLDGDGEVTLRDYSFVALNFGQAGD